MGNKDGTDSRIAHERNQFLFYDHIVIVTIEFALVDVALEAHVGIIYVLTISASLPFGPLSACSFAIVPVTKE